jgi:anti-anti-sigma regulatory factor
MPLHARFEGDVAILSNLGRSMNDPRYTDAGREVKELLDEGFRKFVVDLRGVAEAGPPLLGVLMTVTRQIQQRGGELVLAGMSGGLKHFLVEMRMEDYWEVFRGVREARAFFRGQGDPAEEPP